MGEIGHLVAVCALMSSGDMVGFRIGCRGVRAHCGPKVPESLGYQEVDGCGRSAVCRQPCSLAAAGGCCAFLACGGACGAYTSLR